LLFSVGVINNKSAAGKKSRAGMCYAYYLRLTGALIF
jgi:hypothetical protein